MKRVSTKGQKELRFCINPQENHTKSQKRGRNLVGYACVMWRLGFLKPVASLSGRLINPSGRALRHKHATGHARPIV
jgi:hypothetical protein